MEDQISGEETTVSIVAIMPEAVPTMGNGEMAPDVVTMFLQVARDTDQIPIKL